MADYKNLVPHIDIDRSLESVEYIPFEGIDSAGFSEFKEDVLNNNDAIEQHLVRTKSYRDALIMSIKNSHSNNIEAWKDMLRLEQKTFGGSKIFYINESCSKILVLAVPKEMEGKLAMVINRINKINEKISRMNTKIKKENIGLYSARIKIEPENKNKEEIMNFINKNLRI